MAVEENDRGSLRGKRAVKGTETRMGDRGLLGHRGQGPNREQVAVEEAEGR